MHAGGNLEVGETIRTTARVFWRRLGLLLLGNVIWFALSLPVVTWPAATGGLFNLVRRVVDQELGGAARRARIGDFWEGFRQFGFRGTILALLDLAFGALIAVTLVLYLTRVGEPLRYLVGPVALFGLAWAAMQFYVFPLLMERPAAKPSRILKEALLAALGYPIYTGALLLFTIAIGIPAFILAGPVLLVFFSFMALFQTIALRHLMIERGEIVPESQLCREEAL